MSHDRLNLLSRCMILKGTGIYLFHVQCTFISGFLHSAYMWQHVLWLLKEKCWIMHLENKCSTKDQIPISCLLGCYWTVRNSCCQRGLAFGLLLLFHISSSFWNSTCLCLTMLNFSKFNIPTNPHLLRRISNRYRSTPSILYYCKQYKGKKNQTYWFFIPYNFYFFTAIYVSFVLFPWLQIRVLIFFLCFVWVILNQNLA